MDQNSFLDQSNFSTSLDLEIGLDTRSFEQGIGQAVDF